MPTIEELEGLLPAKQFGVQRLQQLVTALGTAARNTRWAIEATLTAENANKDWKLSLDPALQKFLGMTAEQMPELLRKLEAAEIDGQACLNNLRTEVDAIAKRIQESK